MSPEKIGMDDFIQNGGSAADVENLPSTGLWPTMAPEAFHGLAGKLVKTVDEYSEASPAATLAHFLVGVGNVIGRGPHARVQFDQHPARLFAAIVGRPRRHARARPGPRLGIRWKRQPRRGRSRGSSKARPRGRASSTTCAMRRGKR